MVQKKNRCVSAAVLELKKKLVNNPDNRIGKNIKICIDIFMNYGTFPFRLSRLSCCDLVVVLLLLGVLLPGSHHNRALI